MRPGGSGVCGGTGWEVLALNVASMACFNFAPSNCASEAAIRISAKSRARLVSPLSISSCVGMQFLRNLCRQRVAADLGRWDSGKRQEIGRGQFDRSFKNGITVPNIQVEDFKRTAINQAPYWKAESVPRGTGCRLRWLSHLELKPIAEMNCHGCVKVGNCLIASPGLHC